MLERKWLQRKARDPLATCVGRGQKGKADRVVYGRQEMESEGKTWGNAALCLANVLEAGRCVSRLQWDGSERDFTLLSLDTTNKRSPSPPLDTGAF
jgi:hypothetical protein